MLSRQLSESASKADELQAKLQHSEQSVRERERSTAKASQDAAMLRDDVAAKEAEVRQLQDTVAKMRSDAAQAAKMSGSDRETMLSRQLSETATKVDELEGRVREAERAAQAALLGTPAGHRLAHDDDHVVVRQSAVDMASVLGRLLREGG